MRMLDAKSKGINQKLLNGDGAELSEMLSEEGKSAE